MTREEQDEKEFEELWGKDIKEFNVIEIRTSLFGQQFLLSECERLELRVKELEKEHKGMVRTQGDG